MVLRSLQHGRGPLEGAELDRPSALATLPFPHLLSDGPEDRIIEGGFPQAGPPSGLACPGRENKQWLNSNKTLP